MGVQVQNPDLIVKRGGVCLFVFFLIKNVLEPRLPSTGTLRIFLLFLQEQGRQTSHILCLLAAWYDGHPTQITQQNSILQGNRCQRDR